ncbi:MAG TPA: AraC family transcriptional regulator [Oceanipulchritudo sp.]|nr:AraC family transcriptional regulator [Oceanipulchritudo sp.]
MKQRVELEASPVEVEPISLLSKGLISIGIKSGHYGYWVKKGRLCIESHRKTFTVAEEQLAWVGAGEERKLFTTGPASWTVIRVRNRTFAPGNGADRIAWQALMRLGRLGRLAGTIPLSPESLKGLDRKVREMATCYAEVKDPSASPLMKAGLFRFLIHLIRDPAFLEEEKRGWDQETGETPSGIILQERLQRVLLILEEDPAGLSGAESLARRCGLSRSGLYRLLGKQGMPSPQTLIERARLDLATRLLQQSGKGILEIALEAGFPSLSTFYRAFQRAFGLSPGQWRRQSVAPD